MSKLTIPQNETGTIRVFAINQSIPDMNRAIKEKSKSAVASQLLGMALPDDGFELFPISDLTGVGLPAYLADGHAIPTDVIARDHGKLEGLDGYVLLLFSSAFNGEAKELDTGPDLTLIGTYSETRADMTATIIESEAALPYTGTPQLTPATPPKGRPGSAVMVMAVVAALLLVLIWILT